MDPRLIRLDGKKFGKWLVLRRAALRYGAGGEWICLCECGRLQSLKSWDLRTGRSTGCRTCSFKDRIGTGPLQKLNIGTNVRYLLHNAKQRAKELKLPCTITVTDIQIPKICPLLEIPLFTGVKTTCSNSPTLDRLDSSKGYTKENTWVISHKANTIKSNATLEDLKYIVKNSEKKLYEQI